MSRPVANYLAAAANAVAYVRGKVPYGASNRGSDYVESWEKNHAKIEGPDPGLVDRAMGGMTAFLPLLTGANRALQIWNEVSGNAPSDPIARFRQVAGITMRVGAGNCNEQSITAFVYLHDLGVRPLAWMHLTSGTHAFVLVGRTARSGDDPANWGDSAVVCDPWNKESYVLPAAQGKGILQSKWGCGTATAVFGVE